MRRCLEGLWKGIFMTNTLIMHMADGLISVPIGIVFFTMSLIVLGLSIKKISHDEDEHKIPMMAVMGAFVFVMQMINFTIPGTGSSGHIGGGILLCLILGQYPAFLSLCTVLIIQCLFFGDGGLLALGCNIFNMGILPCFVAYPLCVKPILRQGVNVKSLSLASLLGVIVGLELGAFSVVIETVCSQVTELPFLTFLRFMLPIHLVIGIIEGLITGAIIQYVYKQNPRMIDHALINQSFSKLHMKKVIFVFSFAFVLIGGGLSIYASQYPDGLEWSIKQITNQNEVQNDDSLHKSIEKIQNLTTILPDYHFLNSDNHIGVSTSGIVGGALTLIGIGFVCYMTSMKKNNE